MDYYLIPMAELFILITFLLTINLGYRQYRLPKELKKLGFNPYKANSYNVFQNIWLAKAVAKKTKDEGLKRKLIKEANGLLYALLMYMFLISLIPLVAIINALFFSN